MEDHEVSTTFIIRVDSVDFVVRISLFKASNSNYVGVPHSTGVVWLVSPLEPDNNVV